MPWLQAAKGIWGTKVLQWHRTLTALEDIRASLSLDNRPALNESLLTRIGYHVVFILAWETGSSWLNAGR